MTPDKIFVEFVVNNIVIDSFLDKLNFSKDIITNRIKLLRQNENSVDFPFKKGHQKYKLVGILRIFRGHLYD